MKHLSIELPPFKLNAILNNGATQLQVPVNIQPPLEYTAVHFPNQYRAGFQFYYPNDPSIVLREMPSPYGKKGDFLYVKEEWGTIGPTSQNYLLRATTEVGSPDDLNKSQPWQPARTMPKHLARYWLKVVDISMQRVQSITQEQAIAEGPTRLPKFDIWGFSPAYVDNFMPLGEHFCLGAKVAFKRTFRANYGKLPWENNFWVWVLTFQITSSPIHEQERDEHGFVSVRVVNENYTKGDALEAKPTTKGRSSTVN